MDYVSSFADFSAATVYEAAGKLGDLPPSVRALIPGRKVVGPAFTVKCWPGDGSAFILALEECAPGDVLVIDGGGSNVLTAWGGGSTIAAVRKGIAGVVTNASVRDVHVIRELNFPVYCAGTSVRGGVKHHPGWRGIPIAIGNVPVCTGDLVVGDDDGVVVVARERLPEVHQAALKRRRMEDEMDEKLRRGLSYKEAQGFTAKETDNG